MQGLGKLLKLGLFVFTAFIAVDIIHNITGNFFITLLVVCLIFILYMRFRAPR